MNRLWQFQKRPRHRRLRYQQVTQPTWVDRLLAALGLAILLVLIALLISMSAPPARADATDAVVRIPSHGISGTVIRTESGSSWVLTCAHGFPGSARYKAVQIDAPSPQPGSPQRGGIQVVAVDAGTDLALLKMGVGPLPYVAPVAPAGFKPGACWSVGYDEMRLASGKPAVIRPANITGYQGPRTITRERPWHGRSGGGLIDQATGQLVGVVSAYAGPPNRAELWPGGFGIYASHNSILWFLSGKMGAGGSPPQITEQRSYGPTPIYQQQQSQRWAQPAPWCPGGT